MTFPRFAGPVWSLFRAVVGLLFACHGLASLFGLFGGSPATGQAVPVGVWPHWYAAVIQLVCGGLVLIGLFARPAAILASGSMAYAYFVVHQKSGLLPIENGGVSSALYAWSFLAVAALGAGPWSVEALLSRRKPPAPPRSRRLPRPDPRPARASPAFRYDRGGRAGTPERLLDALDQSIQRRFGQSRFGQSVIGQRRFRAKTPQPR